MNTKQAEIDEAAIMWEKTKDPKYKDLWYKLIKEFSHGTGYYSSKRRIVPSVHNSKRLD
jgi:hypothetical protein